MRRFARTLLAAILATAGLVGSLPGHAQTATATFVATAREPAAGLPGHTVYRPLDLSMFRPHRLPLIVWSNGACRQNNSGVISFLTLLASHGFIVVANGDFDAPYPENGIGVHPELLVGSIDWATRKGVLKNTIDEDRIVVMGRSCGGLDALVAGSDPRVKTTVAIDTGFFPAPTNGYGREWLPRLRAPVLFMNGGLTDSAYQNSIDNYNLVSAPTVLVSNARAGHNGLTLGIRDGSGNEATMVEGANVVVQWLDYVLNGNRTAGRYLLGANCGLCAKADWSVTSRGFAGLP